MSNRQMQTDVILIGAGIMSATLGSLLKELVPDWKITVFEKLSKAGEESSNEWNNAGTGHAALCELNYTTEKKDGSVDISKAIKINEQFQVSMQFWSHLVNSKLISNPQDFIMPLPHMSLVQGEKNVSFLKKRFEAMSQNPLFQGMEFSDDPEKLKEWIPLVMEGRSSNEPIAATKIDTGTDVNFGALTRMLFDHLKTKNVEVNYEHSVDDIKRTSDGSWELKVKNLKNGIVQRHKAKFVFIGGGGGSLHLLQKSGIPEGKRIGGFPVSGIFMVCKNQDIVEQHHAKVYGKAKVGAPPMSVPHLDTRYIDGKKSLLFGPFAGFSPKFLKTGSMFDLITSVKPEQRADNAGSRRERNVVDEVPDPASHAVQRAAYGRAARVYPEREERGLGFGRGRPARAGYQRHRGRRKRNTAVRYRSHYGVGRLDCSVAGCFSGSFHCRVRHA